MAGFDAGQDKFRQILLTQLFALLLLALALGQIGGEVAGKLRILLTERQKGVARDELAEAIFQRGEAVAAAAVKLGAHIEQIIDPVITKLVVRGRLFHRPLDDEIEAGRLIPLF